MTGDAPKPEAKKARFQGDDIRDLLGKCNRRLGELRGYRSSYFTTWRELSQWIHPQRGRFTMPPGQNTNSYGQQKQQQIIDRTATKAVKDLSAFLMAGITSPARNWFRLTIQDQDMAAQEEARLYLDEVQKRMLRVFAVSNFYNAMASLYEELATFGTGCMIIMQDYEDAIRCYTLTAGEYMLAQDQRLMVDTLYREYVLTVGQLVAEFGVENVSPAVRSLYDSNALGREINLVHAIQPNADRKRGAMGWRGMPWQSVHYEYGRQNDQALRIAGFHECPFIAPRWDVVATDVYGHGPAEEALPDVKQLQFMQRRKAEAIDKVVKPPLVGDSQLANSVVSLLPGGLTFVQGGTAGLKPIYQIPPNIEGLSIDVQQTQQRIREAFRTDLITMFANSDRREITAREVDERHEEKMLMLGPMLERFHDEALNPIIDIVFGIMERGRILPQPPPELGGHAIQPDYISLLAQAQKAVGTTAIERTLGFAGSLLGAFPALADKVDADEALDEYGLLLGVSPKIIRGAEDVAAIRDARSKQQQQQAAVQAGLALADGAKTLSETTTGAGKNGLGHYDWTLIKYEHENR